MMRRISWLVVLTLVLWTAPATAMAAGPSNDDIANATSVTALPFADAVPVGEATTQDGEPVETCAPFGNTVWYAVTLDSDANVRVDTAGSEYDTTLAVWVGSGFNDAVLVACNDDIFDSLQAAVTFSATAGTTYFVQAGAFFEAPPDAVLQISFEKQKPGARPTVSRNQFRGSMAEAFSESYDQATETYTFQGVQVLDGRQQTKGQRPGDFTSLFVNSSESAFDETSQIYTFTDWFGFAELEPGQWSIDRRLGGASVAASLTLFGQTCVDDYMAGTFDCTDLGSAEVDANIEWTGQGPTSRSKARSTEQFDGFRLRFSGRSTSRNAAVSGGTAGGMVIDLTGAVGRLAKDANGSWFWATDGVGGSSFQSGMGNSQAILEDTALAGISSVMSDRFMGRFADASSFNFDPDTETYTSQQVSLLSGRSKAKGDRWVSMDQVWVWSSEDSFDEASQTATSTYWFGGAELSAGDYRISAKLGGANVSVSVPLYGETCTYSYEDDIYECQAIGETEVSVDVTWVGEGPTYKSMSSNQEQIDGTKFSFRGRSTGRSASVSGEVTSDVIGWSLDGAFGQLGSQASGSWFKG